MPRCLVLVLGVTTALAAGACSRGHGHDDGWRAQAAMAASRGEARAEDDSLFAAKKPPFTPGAFPCSRCHAGGEPRLDERLFMPHAVHEEKGLECEDCHGDAEGDEDAPALPEWDLCEECHEEVEEQSERARAYFDAALQEDGSYVFFKRWNTADVIPAHEAHIAAEVECSDCHGQVGDGPVTKPRSVPLMDRCTNCHAERGVASDCRTCHAKTTQKQHAYTLDHAEDQRGCLDCHDPTDRDTLRLAGGDTVPFEESFRLCGQCHGPKLRDWRAGLHGKRTGLWNGRKEYLLCAHCHDPHAPAFGSMPALPPPTRPEDVR